MADDRIDRLKNTILMHQASVGLNSASLAHSLLRMQSAIEVHPDPKVRKEITGEFAIAFLALDSICKDVGVPVRQESPFFEVCKDENSNTEENHASDGESILQTS